MLVLSKQKNSVQYGYDLRVVAVSLEENLIFILQLLSPSDLSPVLVCSADRPGQ